jgi:hypothetical protein
MFRITAALLAAAAVTLTAAQNETSEAVSFLFPDFCVSFYTCVAHQSAG